jgi:hypothetical protein
MSRQFARIHATVGKRTVTVQVMDQIGPEDVYEVLFKATIHKFATQGKEDLMAPVPREVKDFMIKSNITI